MPAGTGLPCLWAIREAQSLLAKPWRCQDGELPPPPRNPFVVSVGLVFASQLAEPVIRHAIAVIAKPTDAAIRHTWTHVSQGVTPGHGLHGIDNPAAGAKNTS